MLFVLATYQALELLLTIILCQLIVNVALKISIVIQVITPVLAVKDNIHNFSAFPVGFS